jgi:hypothetical protein
MGIKNVTTQRGSTTKYSEDVHDGINRIIEWAEKEIPKDKGPTWVRGDDKTYPSHEHFSICDDSILQYYGVGKNKLEFLTLLKRVYKDYFDIESNKDNKSDGASGSDILLLRDGHSSNRKVIFGIKFIRRDEFISMEKYNDQEKNINFTATDDDASGSGSGSGSGCGSSPLQQCPNITYTHTSIFSN